MAARRNGIRQTQEQAGMHLRHITASEWLDKHPDYREKYNSISSSIMRASRDRMRFMRDEVLHKTKKKIAIQLSESRLSAALIAAYDDLSRLGSYHEVIPNTLKEMAHVVYWLVRHKPFTLITDDNLEAEKNLSDLAKDRLMYVNEDFGTILLISTVFPGKEDADYIRCLSDTDKRKAEAQLKTLREHLLYYMIYRVLSPKSLESIMLAACILPRYKEQVSGWI